MTAPRVAVVHDLASGGAHRRLAEQLAHLDARVKEFCLSTATPVTDAPTFVPCQLLAARVPALARPPLRYLDLRRVERAWARLSNVVEQTRPDVVFSNPCRLIQSPPLRLRADLPVVYFCDEPRRVDHEPEVARTRRRSTRAVYGPLHRRERELDTFGAIRADLILTNSHYTARQIERAYGLIARVVPLGVADALLAATAGEPQADAERTYVLSVGSLLPGKGHDLVVRAAAASDSRPDVVVVTPRPDEGAAAELSRLAGSLGVPLEIRSAITDAELSRIYVRAIALVYLGSREPYGLASIEAQACGCPVIVADEGGLPETVIDGATGLVVPRAVAPAAGAVDQISANRNRYSGAARRYGRALTWRASGAAVRAAIDEAIAAR